MTPAVGLCGAPPQFGGAPAHPAPAVPAPAVPALAGRRYGWAR
ncbi:hypothetical protein [Kitasatospora indigofera]